MTAIPRRSFRALMLCALVLASQTIVTTSTPQKSCETLRRWAQQYAGTRPTLTDLAPFDRGRRIAIFNAITPSARAALWREQLDRFSRAPELSDAQRALVREGMTLTTPALYRHDPNAAAAMAAFWNRAQGAFARDQRRIWFTLGAGLPVTSAVTRAMDDNWCNCNDGWGWFECESGFCPGGGCHQRLGCGPSGGSACNGRCAL
jgi:hypothetical protein